MENWALLKCLEIETKLKVETNLKFETKLKVETKLKCSQTHVSKSGNDSSDAIETFSFY